MMDYSEKIVSFIDGELDSIESQELFERLAHDPDLQQEMQEMVQLKNMVKSSMITPPDSLKLGIMKKTGLSRSFNKSLTYIGSFVAVFLLGLSSSYFFQGTNDVIPTDRNIAKNEAMVINLNVPKESEPVLSTSTAVNPKIVYIERRSDNPTNSKSEFNDQVSDNFDNVMISNNAEIYPTSLNYSQNDVSLNYDKNSPYTYRTLMNEGSSSNSSSNLYALEIRGIGSQNLHSFNLPNVGGPDLNNFSTVLYYNFTSNFQLGLELGRENFIQKYEERISEFKKRVYEQEITSFWGGLAARYRSNQLDWLLGSELYTKAFVGGISTGPFGRLELGVQYPFVNGARLFFGYEASHTIYMYEKALFQSSKFGPTFGLIFEL